MGLRERNTDGRYEETVTPERVLRALTRAANPVATTSDVADLLGCTSEAARVKLVALSEEGQIERRKVGSSAVVWWLTDEARARGGSAESLFGLVGLFGDDGEAAAHARERSEEWREAFDEEMMADVDDAE